MTTAANFDLTQFTDALLTLPLAPPTAIGGWAIQFAMTKNFGGSSGLIVKSCASGFSGVSGMTVVNSGQGIMTIAINGVDTSGLNTGNFCHTIQRLSSGNVTLLSQGIVTINPNMGR